MEISFDSEKRSWTLENRSLDFADTAKVFAGRKLEFPDIRQDYGEERMITVGLLDERMVVIVWTKRDSARRIISLRKANDREQRKFRQRLS